MGEMNPAIVPPPQRHRNQTMITQGSVCTEMRMGQRRHGRGGQNGSASNAPCVCGQDEYNEGGSEFSAYGICLWSTLVFSRGVLMFRVCRLDLSIVANVPPILKAVYHGT